MDSVDTIALIGLGTIGISFTALYLKHTNCKINLFDPTPDLRNHIETLTPHLAPCKDLNIGEILQSGRLSLCQSLEDACRDADIVQEQGPEKVAVKSQIWQQVIATVSPTTHLWSSTSGITASAQVESLCDKSRLLVVHPFNPPHIVPLVEIVPSPHTAPGEVKFAQDFFKQAGFPTRPIVLHKEVPGFVGNRLAFVLFREACYLVHRGVVSVADLDRIVESSIAPRWAVSGPFKTYNYGGGGGGLAGFLQNLAGTMEDVWNDAGVLSFHGTMFATRENDESNEPPPVSDQVDWTKSIIAEANREYGTPRAEQLEKRNEILSRILQQPDNLRSG